MWRIWCGPRRWRPAASRMRLNALRTFDPSSAGPATDGKTHSGTAARTPASPHAAAGARARARARPGAAGTGRAGAAGDSSASSAGCGRWLAATGCAARASRCHPTEAHDARQRAFPCGALTAPTGTLGEVSRAVSITRRFLSGERIHRRFRFIARAEVLPHRQRGIRREVLILDSLSVPCSASARCRAPSRLQSLCAGSDGPGRGGGWSRLWTWRRCTPRSVS